MIGSREIKCFYYSIIETGNVGNEIGWNNSTGIILTTRNTFTTGICYQVIIGLLKLRISGQSIVNTHHISTYKIEIDMLFDEYINCINLTLRRKVSTWTPLPLCEFLAIFKHSHNISHLFIVWHSLYQWRYLLDRLREFIRVVSRDEIVTGWCWIASFTITMNPNSSMLWTLHGYNIVWKLSGDIWHILHPIISFIVMSFDRKEGCPCIKHIHACQASGSQEQLVYWKKQQTRTAWNQKEAKTPPRHVLLIDGPYWRS